MKRYFAILLLLIGSVAHAQSDVAMHVRKVGVLRITPDSMYFTSSTARTFIIRDIPNGCKLSVDFSGGDFAIRDSVITLTPFVVYRDSDVIKFQSRNISGYKTTKEDFYIAAVTVTAIDQRGEVSRKLARKCFIKPETIRRKQMSANEYDRQLYQNLKKGVTK